MPGKGQAILWKRQSKEISPVNGDKRQSIPAEALVGQIRDQAKNLYVTRQMLCAEAVLVTLNQGLEGGLTDHQAMAMAAPFSMAMGESGCVCGALSGAVMGCGLILGGSEISCSGREGRGHARFLHDAFKAANGATCCRKITARVKHDPKAHFQQCAEVTALAAEMAARLILVHRPELISDRASHFRQDSKISTALIRPFGFFRHIFYK